jgi:hypothetical protein
VDGAAKATGASESFCGGGAWWSLVGPWLIVVSKESAKNKINAKFKGNNMFLTVQTNK